MWIFSSIIKCFNNPNKSNPLDIDISIVNCLSKNNDIKKILTEINQAISNSVGKSIRYSNTLKTEMLYLALRETVNEEIYIIRASVPVDSLKKKHFSI